MSGASTRGYTIVELGSQSEAQECYEPMPRHG